MELVSSIFINRPAETVWAFLENPVNMLLWNPKVKHVSPSSFSETKQRKTWGNFPYLLISSNVSNVVRC